MKTKKQKTVRISSIDFVIVSFLIKLDSIMKESSISGMWNSPGLWNYSYNRYTPVSKSKDVPIGGFSIRLSTWKKGSFINLIMRPDPTHGWKILIGYINNENLGIYDGFPFRCMFSGQNLVILPRIPGPKDRFRINTEAEKDFMKNVPSEDLAKCIDKEV